MKSRIPFLFFLLCFCFTTQAHNGNPGNSTVSATSETSYALDKIFYNDFENRYLFVDFETITDDLIQINLTREGELMMEDDVTDLPTNTIYELNINIFRPGNYTIELVTLQGVKIYKKIIIE